jgi:hypothetical protein
MHHRCGKGCEALQMYYLHFTPQTDDGITCRRNVFGRRSIKVTKETFDVGTSHKMADPPKRERLSAGKLFIGSMEIGDRHFEFVQLFMDIGC